MSYRVLLSLLAIGGLAVAAPTRNSYAEQIIDKPNLHHLLYHLSRADPTTTCVTNIYGITDRKTGLVLTDDVLEEVLKEVKGQTIGEVSQEIQDKYRCPNAHCRQTCLKGQGIRLKSLSHAEAPLPHIEHQDDEKLAEVIPLEHSGVWKPLQDTELGRRYPSNLKMIIEEYPRYFEEKRTRHGHRLSQQALKLGEESEDFKEVAHELWDRVIGRLRFQFNRGLYSDDIPDDE